MGWLRPYSAKAKVEHEFDTNHLNVWITFRFTMDQAVKPADELWLVEADDVPKPVSASAWQDAWTLLLTVPDIAVYPDRVTLEYDGPDENLRITWLKQWEPWGPILSVDIGRSPCFVDRGDSAAWDYTVVDFTRDSTWRDLDLSAVVPAGAKSVLFFLQMKDNVAQRIFYLREKGNVNTKNRSSVSLQVGGIYQQNDLVCPCDTDRKVQYYSNAVAGTEIYLVIKGWWF